MSVLPNISLSGKIQHEIKAQEEKQKYHGSLKMHRGHTLFEINLVNKEIKKAEFQETVYDAASKHNKIRKKVIMRDDCVYIAALNEKNALKKLMKKIKK